MENLKKSILLAVEAYNAGNLSKAEESAKKLIIANPKVVFLYNFLGLISVELKKNDVALEYYQKGIKLDPNFALIYNNMGLLFANNKNDPVKAEAYYKKSISLDKKIPEPHNNLGSLYKSLDRFEESIESYKKAISINANFSYSYHNLGNVYMTIGNFSEAKINFKIAIEKDPNYANSHRSLSRLIKYTTAEHHLKQMYQAYEKLKPKNIENRVNLCFALGKANEDICEFNKSFTFYNEANVTQRKNINFSIKDVKERVLEIKESFTEEIYKKYNGCGYLDSSPIFIVGMPRSGTTLVEQIVSNHPKVFGCDEQEFIPEILNKNFKNHNLNLFFKDIVEFDKNNLKVFGKQYIDKINNISKSNIRTTDKLPENFFWIGFIKLILPKSKIIHCKRNSRDNCFSIYKNHFPSGKINYSYNLAEIVEYYNQYNNLITFWKTMLSDFIYDLDYEKLVLNPNVEIKKLINFCDLDWNDNCLNFHNNKRSVRTASDVQARSKLYNSSINSWKNYEKYLSNDFIKLPV